MDRCQRISSCLILAGAALVGVSHVAGAQSITGTVQTGAQPLAAATVRLLELDRLAYTGTHGDFAFTNVPKGQYHIFVRVSGYTSSTKTIEVSAGAATISFD